MMISWQKSIWCAALAGAFLLPASPAPAADIALHKALYAFKMVSADAGTDLTGVRGQMYYEQDSACDAWTTEHRLSTEYHYAGTQTVSTTGRYVSYETKDGKDFNFNAESQEENAEGEQLRGSAARGADGTGKAVYSRPEEKQFDLPAGYFLPTGHTQEIIRRAQAGERFFTGVMFDGTDAEGPVEISAFIGKKATAEELAKIAAADSKKIDAALLSPQAWHVRMAVFPLVEKKESEPAYEMDIVLHDNGVISRAVVDYKNFTIAQNLVALEKLPAKKCN